MSKSVSSFRQTTWREVVSGVLTGAAVGFILFVGCVLTLTGTVQF